MTAGPMGPDAGAGSSPCPQCDALIPPGSFCGNCGGHLAEPDAGRTRNFAAAPHEHVGQVAVISTLFPHLPHRHARGFSQAFAGGLAVAGVLAALRLYTPAILTAAVLLPVLYAVYLYEVEVYQHEPVTVLLATLVTGAGLGAGYAVLVDRVTAPALSGTRTSVIVTAVLLPLAAQALMVAGPLLLLSRTHFDEALDGLSFGNASALGFTLASAVTGLWHVLTAPLLGSAASSDEVLRIGRIAVLAALVNASATGIITASLWLRHHGRSRRRHAARWRGLEGGIAVALAAQVGLGFAAHYVADLLLLVVIEAAVAAMLIVFLRVVLHYALLEEGAERMIGPITACPECHHLVPTMTFCPACGVARSASPRSVRGGDAAGAPA